MQIGYALSSEEHRPLDLVANAQRAEAAGFDFLSISDHFHPWTDRQGQSPFVWSTIGGIATTTAKIELGTGVTCPLIRTHPAIIAQAAATAASMMPGRFYLGLGTGENLNEHILGDTWPSPSVRLEMLEEAIELIRRLWTGEEVSHRGRHYEVDRARIYTLPERPPPIMVAAGGTDAAELAGKVGDGLVSTSADPELVEQFEQAGGRGKPCYGMTHVCWAPDESAAVQTGFEWWPNSALPGQLNTELATPSYFEQATELVGEEHIPGSLVCGPNPKAHLEMIDEYEKAGFDHIFVHQVGPDQTGFLNFYETQVLPER
ncbi:MAG: TIGR03557 family F420-dependent LLM class oxidoreductase [Actinobacteria bacterium]|nr:TIGR03557 family F420-dependent LLM class oxidoreductase [Actinomycetota bacterium]